MIKLLHSADWHLDSPLQGRTEAQARYLRDALQQLPRMVVEAARAEGCNMILLSGDLFDGPCSPESLQTVSRALQEAQMPVLIAPGNHDPYRMGSCWQQHIWPENVHIFSGGQLQSVALPELDCRVYGCAFTGPYMDGLPQPLRAQGPERFHIAVLHADPTLPDSPYCPITAEQVRESGLDYLGLGHIHKAGSFRAGSALCAWPGCPMGRGFDECGEKGVLIVTLDETAEARFLPLDVTRFHDFTVVIDTDPAAALAASLPPAAHDDYFRITLTGESPVTDIADLRRQFSQYQHLELIDKTVTPVDLWATAGEDTLEGIYFQLLREQLDSDPGRADQIRLAAKISRKLLDGQEVVLP